MGGTLGRQDGYTVAYSQGAMDIHTEPSSGSGTPRKVPHISRRRLRLALSGLAVATIALCALTISAGENPRVGWRLKVLGHVLRGKAPGMSLADTLFVMLPDRIIERHKAAMAHLAGVDWGELSTRHSSKLGPFWGRPPEGGFIAALVDEQVNQHVYDVGEVRVREGDVVLDVGAHIGTFTRFALSKGARQVVAYEPDPVNLRYLRRNCEAELKGGRVLVVAAAAWRSRGNLRFSAGGPNSGSGVVSDSGGMNIPAVTIDESLRELGNPEVNFIKMDIEGAERHALEGARQTISQWRPRMAICIYHKDDDPEAIPAIVQAACPAYTVIRRKEQNYFYVPRAKAGM